jgi:predicted RNase H-like HicB family nuclease
MENGNFTALVYKEENGYLAECPELGTTGRGETPEAAIASLKEATKLHLEEFPLSEHPPRQVADIKVRKSLEVENRNTDK